MKTYYHLTSSPQSFRSFEENRKATFTSSYAHLKATMYRCELWATVDAPEESALSALPMLNCTRLATNIKKQISYSSIQRKEYDSTMKKTGHNCVYSLMHTRS